MRSFIIQNTMGQTNITSQDLADIFELFTMGIPIGGILSAIVWGVAYTLKKCIAFFKM